MTFSSASLARHHAGALQQALDYHIQGDPYRRALAATWGADQARRVRGH